jgi:hypothetical protein
MAFSPAIRALGVPRGPIGTTNRGIGTSRAAAIATRSLRNGSFQLQNQNPSIQLRRFRASTSARRENAQFAAPVARSFAPIPSTRARGFNSRAVSLISDDRLGAVTRQFGNEKPLIKVEKNQPGFFSRITQPKSLLLMGGVAGVVALKAAFVALAMKIGPMAATHLVAQHVMIFLSPGTYFVGFALELALKTVTSMVVYGVMPIVLPILSTIVVTTLAVGITAYVAYLLLQACSNRLKSACDNMPLVGGTIKSMFFGEEAETKQVVANTQPAPSMIGSFFSFFKSEVEEVDGDGDDDTSSVDSDDSDVADLSEVDEESEAAEKAVVELFRQDIPSHTAAGMSRVRQASGMNMFALEAPMAESLDDQFERISRETRFASQRAEAENFFNIDGRVARNMFKL